MTEEEFHEEYIETPRAAIETAKHWVIEFMVSIVLSIVATAFATVALAIFDNDPILLFFAGVAFCLCIATFFNTLKKRKQKNHCPKQEEYGTHPEDLK